MKYPIGTLLIFNLQTSLRKVIGYTNDGYTLEVMDDNQGHTHKGYIQTYDRWWVEDTDNYRFADEHVVDGILTKYQKSDGHLTPEYE